MPYCAILHILTINVGGPDIIIIIAFNLDSDLCSKKCSVYKVHCHFFDISSRGSMYQLSKTQLCRHTPPAEGVKVYFVTAQHLFTLTASFLITVVRAVVAPVAHLDQGDAVSIVTSELPWGAGRRWRVTHALQLIRLVTTVVVPITDEVVRDASAVLAGELVLLAGLVGAALLVAAVPAVITSITPDLRRQVAKH